MPRLPRLAPTLLLAFSLSGTPAFAVNRDMVQLQTQIQQLQDTLARLQQSNDERMGVLRDLVQQSADSVNRMSVSVDTLQKQLAARQEAEAGKVDQVSGQVQALNDSFDEMKARLIRLEKLMKDVQGQQQSMSANLPAQAAGTGAVSAMPQAGNTSAAEPLASAPLAEAPGATLPATPTRRGKPSAGLPALAPTGPAPTGAPPADDLFKTALGDYMAAKYGLAGAEFGDVVKFYPDNPLAGSAFYYQGEIDYRGGRYAAAAKNYDRVLEQYPDNSRVPASHLHKGQALLQLKQNDAAVREFRTLIQRFPNSPEATQARSRLSAMAVPVTPRTAAR